MRTNSDYSQSFHNDRPWGLSTPEAPNPSFPHPPQVIRVLFWKILYQLNANNMKHSNDSDVHTMNASNSDPTPSLHKAKGASLPTDHGSKRRKQSSGTLLPDDDVYTRSLPSRGCLAAKH